MWRNSLDEAQSLQISRPAVIWRKGLCKRWWKLEKVADLGSSFTTGIRRRHIWRNWRWRLKHWAFVSGSVTSTFRRNIFTVLAPNWHSMFTSWPSKVVSLLFWQFAPKWTRQSSSHLGVFGRSSSIKLFFGIVPIVTVVVTIVKTGGHIRECYLIVTQVKSISRRNLLFPGFESRLLECLQWGLSARSPWFSPWNADGEAIPVPDQIIKF